MKFKNAFPYLILTFFLLTGIINYKNYGISWDEHFQRHENGLVVWDYLTTGNRSGYENNPEKYHGPAFEILLIAIEKITGVQKTASIFFQRHLVTYLFFWLSGVALFLLLRFRYSSSLIISIGLCWYFLMPRIFADAFYNSKDIPFLAVTMFSLVSMNLLVVKKTLSAAVLHGCICGILIGIRLMGIVIPALTLIMLLYLLIENNNNIRKVAITGFIFLISTVIFTIIFWPILWQHPFHHFNAAWNEMSKFPWDKEILFDGKYYNSGSLPWYYTLKWIFISTPLLYLLVGTTGIIITFYNFITKKLFSFEIIYILLIAIPIFLIIILKPVIYDGWRHIYFIYAPFCLLMVFGLDKMLKYFKKAQTRYLIISTVILCTLSTGYWIFNWNPYQNIYFNQLAGAQPGKNYELDYWGLSYRKALEKLSITEKRTEITVYVANAPGIMNSWILNDSIQKRFIFAGQADSAEYFITNYRWNNIEDPKYQPVDSIVVDKIRISGTYRINNN